MKQKRLSLLIGLSVLAASPRTTVKAQDNEASCYELMEAADQAIRALEGQVAAEKELSRTLDEQLKLANKYNKELMERQNAWYRDPQTIGTVSLVAGLVLGAWIARQK